MKTLNSLSQLTVSQLTSLKPCKKILLHSNAHTDEMVVLALRKIFKKETEARFPGMSTAPIEEWGWGQSLPLASDDDGVIGLGVLEGDLDEHNTVGYADTCAAELFAEQIGVLDKPAVRLLIETIKAEDRKGAADGASIHSVLKLVWRVADKLFPVNFKNIMRCPTSSGVVRPTIHRTILWWVVWAYIAEYQKLCEEVEERGEGAVAKVLTFSRAYANIKSEFGEKRALRWQKFYDRVKKERDQMRETTRRHLVTGAPWIRELTFGRFTTDGRVRSVRVLVFDSLEFCYFVPTVLRHLPSEQRPDISIIRQPNGHLAIMSDQAIDLTEVACALRVQELKLIQGDKPVFTAEELSARGSVSGWPKMQPYWHLHDKAVPNQLYCGAESAPLTSGSAIPLDRIVMLIQVVLGNKYHPEHHRKCAKGVCKHTCPWFNLHMRRCLAARKLLPSNQVVEVR